MNIIYIIDNMNIIYIIDNMNIIYIIIIIIINIIIINNKYNKNDNMTKKLVWSSG